MAVMFHVLVARGADSWPARLRDLLAPAVALPQGLALVPLTDKLTSRLGGPDTLPEFNKLTVGVANAAAEASRHGPTVYVQQETFAGLGFETSMVWHDGTVTFGPCFTANDKDERLTAAYTLVTDPAGNAINQALRHVGVTRGAAQDEYATIGLDRHRRTNDWLTH